MSRRPRDQIAWAMASIIVKNIFTLVSFMVLARLMEPASFGSISIALMLWGLLYALVDSGFTSVVVRQKELEPGLLSSLYWWNVGVGLFAALALWVAAPVAAGFFKDPRLAQVLSLAAGSLFFVGLGQQFVVVLQRELAFRSIALIEMGNAAIAFCVTMTRAFAGAGPSSYFEGLLAGYAFQALAAYMIARSTFSPRLMFSFANIRSVLKFGVFNTGERCVSFITGNMEKPLVGRLFSMADLGLYTVVNQLVTRPVSLFSSAFSRVAYSLYAKVQNDHTALNDLYIQYSGKLALITFPLYGFFYLFSDTIIGLLFGAAFLPATAFMAPLCILGALWSVGNPLSAYLMALNKAGTGFYLNCWSAAVTAGALLIGSRWSLQTMLVLWVAAVVVLVLPVEWAIRHRLTRMSLTRYLARVAPTALIVAMLTVAGKMAFRILHQEDGLFTIAISMLAYAAVYAGYAWWMYKRVWRKK